MLARDCTIEDLQKALEVINEKYRGNIEFREIEQKTKNSIRFTLKCKSCKEPGHREHIRYEDPFGKCIEKRKRSSCACWHVHGDFFDALFGVEPGARVKSGSMIHAGINSGWITRHEGNWIDTNIGSSMFPVYFSDSCNCDPNINQV